MTELERIEKALDEVEPFVPGKHPNHGAECWSWINAYARELVSLCKHARADANRWRERHDALLGIKGGVAAGKARSGGYLSLGEGAEDLCKTIQKTIDASAPPPTQKRMLDGGRFVGPGR